jgi:type III secretion protein U
MANKTEKATPKRLRDARKKGQVARSKEVVSMAIISGIFFWLWIKGADIFAEAQQMIILPTEVYSVPFREGLTHVMTGVIKGFVNIVLPILVGVVLLIIMANFFQFGFLFTTKPITPDFKKINPAQGIKKIFSMDNLMELIKSIIKVSILGFLLYGVISASIDPLLKLPWLGIDDVIPIIGALFAKIAIITVIAFSFVAFADLAWQKYHFQKKQMMSKDEVKREYKEMEGDPIVKGKRRQLQREIAMSTTMEQTRKASVVITNPTRLAVAMYYEKEKTKLPVILAKGEGLLARRIVEIAKEENIPVLQNVPLARDLYEQVAIDDYIPSDLIEPVAEVLRWLQELKESKNHK